MTDETSVRMDDLLAHRQWVRALARRLAADESSADDLEQATWLAAAEHPPRDARSVRGWLGTVLRNVHRNSLRGDAHRGEREEAASRPEPPRSPDEIVAEAETQHVLVREVLALDEPYRTTVLLRWFEDLTPTEIAARLGVPIDTVKTRLRRAVEQLRARMDARHGGDRRAWCLLLVGHGDGFGKATGIAGGTKAAATAAAGGMAMGLAMKGTIAAAVVVALGLMWWKAGDAVAPAPAPGSESADAASSPSPKRPHRATVADESAAPTPSPVDPSKADRETDLHGVVVRTDGSAVVGARIQAIAYPWRRTMTMNVAALFDGRAGASTTSADAGAFSLRLRRGEATVVRVSADGLATVELGPYQAGERVEIEMTAAVKLHVAVRDEGAGPVAGATLWLLGFGTKEHQPWVNVRAVTDAAGKCEFDGLPGGAALRVLPLAGVGDFGGQRVALPASGESSVEIVVPPGRTIRGRVFDAASLGPVVGATVGLGKGVVCATTTDGGGRFELRGFTGKGESSVQVIAAGYSISVLRVGETDAIEVPLRRGLSASGRIVDSDGRPVSGAFVSVEASQRGAGPEQFSCGYSTTGADGRFAVADLDRAMAHVLTAFASDFGRVRAAVTPPNADAASVDVGDVKLSPPRAIGGRVLKPDGSPSPGVDVRLVGPNVARAFGNGALGTQEERRTDDLGRFRFGDLAPGEYSVEMGPRGDTAPSTMVTLPADRDVLDVVLPPKPTGEGFSVLVVNEAGTPLVGATVLGRRGYEELARVRTDAAGRVVVPSSSKGTITSLLVAWPLQGEPYLVPKPVKVVPGQREYRLVAERAASVPVRLLDADGRPIARAHLMIEPREIGGTVLHKTNADGRVDAVVPRSVEVSIVFPGGVYDDKGVFATDTLQEARQDGVSAQSGEVVLRCRRVETGRSVTVRVLAADGSPVAGASLWLVGGMVGIHREAKTDDEGRARFDDLPAHELYVNAMTAPGMLVPPPAKLVPAGQEVVLTSPAAVSITGSVRWSSGEAAVGAGVTVMRGDDFVFTTNADAQGAFTIHVPTGDAGPFKVTAYANDGKRIVSAERACAPSDSDLRFELQR